MVMRYIKTITVLIPLQHVPTIRTQIINLSFHMTPVVSPVDATGHAAPHNVFRNSIYFTKK